MVLGAPPAALAAALLACLALLLPDLRTNTIVFAKRWVPGAAVLLLLAALVPAPLETPADPAHAPNPAKSAWFLLWIQELVSYSTLAAGEGLVVSVNAGIGYETPWRQVEAMLLLAAASSIALGAGGNIAVFSLAREFLLGAPDVRDPEAWWYSVPLAAGRKRRDARAVESA